MPVRRFLIVTVLAGLAVLARVPGASAQPAAAAQAPAQPTSQGPLLVEPIRDRYVVAPEAKVTEVDGTTTGLVGGYGGVLFQGNVLFGGGVYTLPNGPNGTELTYGGLVAGVVFGEDRRVTYGVRGLVGIGAGELTSSFRYDLPGRPTPVGGGPNRPTTAGTTVIRDVHFDETFMVAEPQADLIVRLADNWRIAFGVGYRFTNASEYMSDRLDGVTGSVAIVFGSR